MILWFPSFTELQLLTVIILEWNSHLLQIHYLSTFQFLLLNFQTCSNLLIFLQYTMDYWFRISLSFSIMHNTNKIQHKKAFIHIKPTLTSTVLHSLYQKPLHSNFILFVQFLRQGSTQKFLSIHISHTFIVEFLLSHCFFYFAWFDSNKLIFTCSSVLTICIHTTIINSL